MIKYLFELIRNWILLKNGHNEILDSFLSRGKTNLPVVTCLDLYEFQAKNK